MHCKRLTPTYEAAAEFLNQQDADIALARVECDVDDGLCVGLTGYPTLGLFHGKTNGDKFVEFTGDRSAANLVSFASNGTISMPVPPEKATTTTRQYSRPTKTPPPNPSPDATASNAILLLNEGREALVKLELPGLAWRADKTNGNRPSSCALLDFVITGNGKHLSLGGQKLALTVPNPSIPRSPHVGQVDCDYDLSLIDQKIPLCEQMSRYINNETEMGLDYAIDARNRDDPNIRYYNYHPQIYFDIIGAKSLLLDMPSQKTLEIKLYDKSKTTSTDPRREFRIEKILFHDRPEEYHAPRPYDKACSLWSYRCADIADPPWYKYVWRSEFDEYGRIGSLRRVLLMRWRAMMWFVSSVWYKLPWPAWLLVSVAAVGGMVRRRVKLRRAEAESGGLPMWTKRSKA